MFIVFKSSDLYPKFPGQTEPLALHCKLSALSALLSAQGPVDCTAFRCFCQLFGLDGAGDTLHSGWGYVSGPLPGWEGDGPLQATLSFSNRLSGWKGLEATLRFGYELIPLPVHKTSRRNIGAKLLGTGRLMIILDLISKM